MSKDNEQDAEPITLWKVHQAIRDSRMYRGEAHVQQVLVGLINRLTFNSWEGVVAISTIADDLGFGYDTVQRALKRFEQDGAIRVHRRFDAPSKYTLCYDLFEAKRQANKARSREEAVEGSRKQSLAPKRVRARTRVGVQAQVAIRAGDQPRMNSNDHESLAARLPGRDALSVPDWEGMSSTIYPDYDEL